MIDLLIHPLDLLPNMGKIEGDGFEMDLGVDILRSPNDGVNWSVNTNFTSNNNKVTDLGQDTDLIVFAGARLNLGNAAIEGQELGALVGTRIATNDQGEFLVDSAGDFVEEQGQFVIGDPNPDWILNVNNNFSWKGFNFSFLLNYTKGGDVYSRTVSTLLGRGLTTDTVDRINTFILPGVQMMALLTRCRSTIPPSISTMYFLVRMNLEYLTVP